MIGQSMLRKVHTKKFKTKEQATKWAKAEKKKVAPGEPFKWETNRLDNAGEMKWEAVIYRELA